MKTHPRTYLPDPGVRFSSPRRVSAPLPPRVRVTPNALRPDGYLPPLSYVRVFALLGIIAVIALLAAGN